MRLTLRTLLAYLDNTVEAEDAELLREKLEQSGFATQLVQRIRASLIARTLSAPAPDSVHPIEEPNMMSEYLDSTLSPEQVAEVEKACLESETHLAEAAACHQILTMILGRPADVSDDVRNRIYDMVDADGNVVASGLDSGEGSPIAGEIGPRHSSIDLGAPAVTISPPTDLDSMSRQPVEPASGFAPGGEPVDRDAETVDLGAKPISGDAPKSVPPVGVDDSGVFEAASKLREQSFATPGAEEAAMAGDRPLRSLERSDLYEGDVRTSRITPWLVSLALVGALLFAVGQIFLPLFSPKKVAQEDTQKMSEQFPDLGPEEVVVPADLAPPMESVGDGAVELDGKPEATEQPTDAPDELSIETVDIVELPAPVDPEVEMPAPVDPADPLPGPDPDSITEEAPRLPIPAPDTGTEPMPVPVPDVPAPIPGAPPAPESIGDGSQPADLPIPPPTDPGFERIAMVDKSNAPADVSGGATADVPAPIPPPPANEESVATLLTENALVAASTGESPWALLAANAGVSTGQTIVCGPEYRAAFKTALQDDANVTMVGPSKLRFKAGGNLASFDLKFGRAMAMIKAGGDAIFISSLGIVTEVVAKSDNVVFAVERFDVRDLGSDPMVPENHRHFLRVIASGGALTVNVSGKSQDLEINQQLVVPLSAQEFELTAESLDSPPAWTDPETDTGSLESEAAPNLLELARTGGPDLLTSLRVALSFRQSEVAALAGKTMLALGDASAYFGIDGLLSQPKQRLYWSSHLDALRKTIDRSVDDAIAVRNAKSGNEAMDNADGETMFRLLIGYSQDQLKTGGDAELVKGLESASMPVRVLASENLRDISGTTLFFKPEETVESRREEVVKKWNVRLRKESIRWPDGK